MRYKYSSEDVERIIKAVPNEPSEEIQEDVRSRMHQTVLIYRSSYIINPLTEHREQKALVKCIECQQEYYLDCSKISGCSRSYLATSDPIAFFDETDKQYKSSYDTCYCQECGANGYAMHISRLRYGAKVQDYDFYTFENVEGCFAILAWRMRKTAEKDGRVVYRCVRRFGQVYINKPESLSGMTTVYPQGSAYYDSWRHIKKYKTLHDILYPSCFKYFDRNVLYSTNMCNSGFEEYINLKIDDYLPFEYLYLYMKYPSVENLVRQGAGKVVSDVLSKCFSSGYNYWGREFWGFDYRKAADLICWDKKSPSSMLGLNKTEFKFLKNEGLKIISFYLEIKNNYCVRLDLTLLDVAKNLSMSSVLHVLKSEFTRGFLKPVHFLNYMAKQRLLKDGYSAKVDCSFYLDYIDYVIEFYGEVSESLLYPKDLVLAHDMFVLRVEEKINADIDNAIRQVAKNNSVYSYVNEDLGLMIVPCGSHSEIIKEGKLLSHCVARYAKSYSEGKTNIFFIRHIDTPEIPFYTLEFDGSGTVQNRGYKNC